MDEQGSHVRAVNSADLYPILAIEQSCYRFPWSLRHFVQELENPVASILVYDIDGVIVGYICYWLIAGEMQILNLAISPQSRRRGIAGRLLESAIEKCGQDGLSSAWLEVRAGNQAAIALYRGYGFKADGVRRAYYQDGEDALLMGKMFECQKAQEIIQ